jgi:hypothetical protein
LNTQQQRSKISPLKTCTIKLGVPPLKANPFGGEIDTLRVEINVSNHLQQKLEKLKIEKNTVTSML